MASLLSDGFEFMPLLLVYIVTRYRLSSLSIVQTCIVLSAVATSHLLMQTCFVRFKIYVCVCLLFVYLFVYLFELMSCRDVSRVKPVLSRRSGVLLKDTIQYMYIQ